MFRQKEPKTFFLYSCFVVFVFAVVVVVVVVAFVVVVVVASAVAVVLGEGRVLSLFLMFSVMVRLSSAPLTCRFKHEVKGEQKQEARWRKNIKNVRMLASSVDFIWLFYQYLYKGSAFLLRTWLVT